MPSGWMRWMMEQYEFEYKGVFPQELDKGNLAAKFKENLAAKFDALILASGSTDWDAKPRYPQPKPSDVKKKWRSRLGKITREKTIPQLKEFMESGKSVFSIGTSTNIGYELGLPISSHLVDGQDKKLEPNTFFIPVLFNGIYLSNSEDVRLGE